MDIHTVNNIVNEGKPDLCFKNFIEKSKNGDYKLMELAGNLIHAGEIVMIAGKTGVGKSILSYTLADAISKGKMALNLNNESQPLKVIYFDFELQEGHIQQRFTNYDCDENFLRPDIDEVLLSNEDNSILDTILIITKEADAKVVFIDNISAISLKSTQDPETSLKLIKQAKEFARREKVTIIMVHHTPKIKESKPLELYDIAGSSVLHNFIDSAIMIGKSSKGTNLRYIKQVKSRNANESDEVIIAKIVDDNWLHLEFDSYDYEKNHIIADTNSIEKRREENIRLAEEIIGNGEISFTDFINKYADSKRQSKDNGKKKLYQLVKQNILIKLDNKKYIINRNEVQE